METTIVATAQGWVNVREALLLDTDLSVPKTGGRVTLVNRGTTEIKIKRTGKTTAPTVAQGFILDPVNTGISHITLDYMNFTTSWVYFEGSGARLAISFETE
jgi:hypothetical protein